MIKNFKNGNFIIFDGELLKLVKGSMQVEDERVLSFNDDSLNFDEEVDLDGNLVTPVFCNLHLHLGEKYFKLKKQMPLMQYLDWTEKINKSLGEDKNKLWLKSAHETIEENQRYGNYVLCTLRGNDVLSKYNVVSYAGFPVMKSEKLQEFYLSGFEGYKKYCEDCKSKNITSGVFLHSMYYTDDECLEYAKKCHEYSNTFLAVHVGEDKETEKMVENKFGKSSLQVLVERDLLSEKTALIHCCEYSDEQLDLISRFGSTVVVCPFSNQNLLQKPLDPTRALNKGINWAVASDGLGSGETADLLGQLGLLHDLYKDVSFVELFKSITINPCKFLGCTDLLLQVGGKCNFNVFKAPRMKDIEGYLKWLIELDEDKKYEKAAIDSKEKLCYNTFSERRGE